MAAASKKFSIRWFSVKVWAQYGLLLLGLRTLFPDLWASQLSGGVLKFLCVFLSVHLFKCFFEWAFHRYVLHAVTTPWLQEFARSHRHHHGLTPIRLHQGEAGASRKVLNQYPIVDVGQYEDAVFPPYALIAFWLVFTPPLVALQLLFPHWPYLVAGYAAVTWSLYLYETVHAIEHWPYEWWKQAVEHPRFGALWRRIYGFHHMHHANVSCNEAISGFFTFPLADWALGTYHQPKELLLEGRQATAKDFAIPPASRIVRAADAWARKREDRILRNRRIKSKKSVGAVHRLHVERPLPNQFED